MTPIEKDKLQALCAKWKLSELGISKGIFMADDNTGITMNLRGDMPVVGVTIAGTLHTEGHGNLKVPDLQAEVDQIMKSKTIPKSKSSVPEHSEKQPPQNSLAAQISPEKDKSKLGTGDTRINKTTAICRECGTAFETTLDNASQLIAQFSELYCLECRENHKPGTTAKSEQKPSLKIPKCRKCGVEVAHARALECMGVDEPCTCEDCGEKHDDKKHQETEKGKAAQVDEPKARPEEPKGVKPMEEKGLVVHGKPVTEVTIVKPLTQTQIIEAATSTAKLLADVVEKAKLYSMISGKKYTRVEGWETLGALLLCSSEIVKTEEYKNGYMSEAIIRNQDGKVISNGVGICMKSEKNWATRDDFAICSMSQTRAIGKAYRLGFAWIMSLAGYEVCPVEEME